MDPYSYNPNAGPPENQGPSGSPYGPPPGYTPGPETSYSIGYPPPGAPVPPPGPYAAPNPYQGGYPGMPPQYAVPPQRTGIPAAGWVGIALGIVLLVGLGITGIVIALDDADSPSTTTADDDGGAGGDTDSDTSSADPTEAVVADPVADAVIGDCFYNNGDETTPDLETAVCGAGAFETVDIVEGTSDLASCDGMPSVNLAVNSTGVDRVLCLSYNVMDGDDAYHAQVDQCVYGTSVAGSAWYVIDCQDGAFKVIERLDGQSSTSSCSDSTYYIYGLAYSTGSTYLDTTLCLQMMYASGDIGYAEIDDCLSMNSDYTYAEFVSDCDDGNAYVTGRTNEIVDGESWCNGWGWAYEEVPDFPELSFTVCWGWL
ncbi:hypothetical protein SAMN05216298_3427 [Glycomyces sambucus]|uniref:Uncharacterized protein n=1 Tax=Glycomyces sambucus TaxID=380244 RepID=A0A1G9J695_9ACTN|nr:hypothetical protein [Glycomyces sambucus]SDL32684.1 hypothetical protein SAMN05216298_3427 [Glycomyces sambucus]